MATLKEIFQQVSMMNPTVNYMSSIGEYVDSNAQQLADYVIEGSVEEVVPKMIKYYKENSK